MATAAKAAVSRSRSANRNRFSPEFLTPVMEKNIAEGRPPNVSASEVAIGERQAVQREADSRADAAAKEFGDSLSLGGESIGARDEKVANFRAAFVLEQEKEAGKGGQPSKGTSKGTGMDGISIRDQIAISAEQRAQRGEAGDVAAAEKMARLSFLRTSSQLSM